MIDFQQINLPFLKKGLAILSIVFSGLCWYFSVGLSGSFPFLLWIAPIPILILSLKTSGKQAFLLAFIAYLIGRLSWFHYLVMVATMIPAIIFTFALSLIFALIVTISRKIIIKIDSWFSIFVFPVFFTTFEFLLISVSPDGTAASIAYSQSNLVPVIQIASLTGILGITFLVTFIPSAISLCWFYRKQKMKLRNIMVVSLVLLTSILLFGTIRISKNYSEKTIKVGLTALDESCHNMSPHPDFKKELLTAEYYAEKITDLASKGAKVVVLPERAINIDKETENDIIHIFGNAAKQNAVCLIIGYTNFRDIKKCNSALVINEEGRVITDYTKVHLVTGLESQFTPGNAIGLFNTNGVQAGTAICKDLDFPNYIQKYGKNNVSMLFIPAWDFEIDDWLHSRMAILRGVEFGFSEIRSARQGRLTISDCYGRVTDEANCSKGQKTNLIGIISIQNRNTIYSRFGDYFGWINLVASFSFIIIAVFNKKTN